MIVNSINPDRIAGQKTAAFEIVDEIGDAPDFHLLPVGNAGNITRLLGRLSANIIHKADRERCRSCSVSRPLARLRFFTTGSSSNLRRSRRPSELVIPRVGNKPRAAHRGVARRS